MALLNGIIKGVFDLYLALFAWGGPWAEVAALAFLTAVIAMLIFRYTSNQRAIRRIKDLILSHLLEIALFRDDLRVVLRAQRRILWDNLRYLAHAVVPLLCMVIPVAVVFAQGELRYSRRQLRVGEKAILAVKLRPGADIAGVRLEAPSAIVIETPALRIPALNEVDWRIRGASTGRHDVHVLAGGTEGVKLVSVGDLSAVGSVKVAVSPLTGEGGGWQQFLVSGDGRVQPGGQIASIRVGYPTADLKLLRWHVHWLWPWLALSLLFGYALKGPLRVQI